MTQLDAGAGAAAQPDTPPASGRADVPPAGANGELTIDELAARTGLTVRTVRFYASEGLLPPPVRRGRVAYYEARHRMRLELIRTMQEHGYTLAAIHRALARIPLDADPAQYATQAAVLAPWLTDQREELDRAALQHRAGRALDDDTLGYLTAAGAIQPTEAGTYRVAPATLGMALELLELPVPLSVLRASTQIVTEHATAVAEGLTEVFVQGIWGPYRRGELTEEQVVAMLVRLRPLAVEGLTSTFVQAADRAARSRPAPH